MDTRNKMFPPISVTSYFQKVETRVCVTAMYLKT